MKRLGLSVGLAVLFCGAMSALASAAGFSFQTVIFPGDTFTQLLGINDFDLVAGYHGATVNQGFVLTPPSHFTPESFPGSTQTQVIAINNFFKTAGFYITGGVTHGFLPTAGGTFSTVDFPGTGFNQNCSV